jgi:hypothetical protein
VILALVKLRQKDGESKASPDYTAEPCPKNKKHLPESHLSILKIEGNVATLT